MRAWAAAAALLLAAAGQEQETFANDDLGLAISFPAGSVTCRDDARRDRVAMYLDGGLEGCAELDQRPHIEIRASENADRFASAQQVVAELCGPEGKNAPPDLAFGARRSASCRSDSPDSSWVDVFVVTQADGQAVAKLNYQAQLHTTLERLRDDLAAFRGFIAHDVQLGRPEFVDTVDSKCRSAQTQAEKTACAAARSRRADATLARSEAKLEKISSPDQARAFDQARDAWLEFRKLHCEAVASLREGAARPQAASECSAALSEDRARELDGIIESGGAPR